MCYRPVFFLSVIFPSYLDPARDRLSCFSPMRSFGDPSVLFVSVSLPQGEGRQGATDRSRAPQDMETASPPPPADPEGRQVAGAPLMAGQVSYRAVW